MAGLGGLDGSRTNLNGGDSTGRQLRTNRTKFVKIIPDKLC